MTILPTNTDSEQPTNLPATTGRSIATGAEPSATDLQVLDLQDKLVRSEDDRKEERFLWFTVTGLMFNTIVYMAAGAVAGGFVSFVYLAMLIVLSKRWGFEGLWEAFYEAKKLIGSGKGNGED